MTYHRALVLLLCCALLASASCQQTSIADQEQIRNISTIQAGTPSPTPTLTPTLTPSPTLTPTPTTGPTPTPTPSPIPSPTPFPPTPTPNPALANFSLCTQTAGDLAGGRFSARVTAISTTVEPAFERLTLALEVPGDSVAPHAYARCVPAADAPPPGGDRLTAGGGYLVLLDLADWLHDDLFRASVVTPTVELSGTTVLKQLTYRFDPSAAVGAQLAVRVEQPLPFRVTLAESPLRLVLEVGKTSPLNASSDPLVLPSPGSARPATPLFYLRDGDVWQTDGITTTNLTESPEFETALAVSPAGDALAVCRAAPGVSASDPLAPSTLWTMDAEGDNQVQLAAIGRSCAQPAFSPDGKTIALAVDETGAAPQQLSIWTVPAEGGTPEQVSPARDEWSRFGPQWLGSDRLVYAAAAEDGRSTLFVASGGEEQDIGAALVKGDRYVALGAPLASPKGDLIAVEGLRPGDAGADLLLLGPDGTERDTVGDDYWARPLAWAADGTLHYLTSVCASGAVLNYTLHARAPSGSDQLLAIGVTTGGLGAFSAVANGLAYVSVAQVPPGPRGAYVASPASPSALWFWELSSGLRSRLVESPNLLSDVDG